MREILFTSAYKAKRTDNGEWVYWDMFGQIVGIDNCTFQPVLVEGAFLWHIREIYSIIDRNTISRCTGSTDKNGEKIFAGDILEKDWMCEDGQLYIVSFGYHLPLGCGVDTARNATGWYLDRINDSEYGGCTRTDGATGICTQIKYVDLFDLNIGITTIRGNKWDNPELVSEDGK